MTWELTEGKQSAKVSGMKTFLEKNRDRKDEEYAKLPRVHIRSHYP